MAYLLGNSTLSPNVLGPFGGRTAGFLLPVLAGSPGETTTLVSAKLFRSLA